MTNKKYNKLMKYGIIAMVLMAILLFMSMTTGKDLTFLTIFSLGIAFAILIIDKKNRELYIASGIISAFIDFVYEHIGTANGSWSYSTYWLIPNTNVPFTLPLIYFGLGVMFAKFIKFIEGVANEIGYLKPKMPLEDVFKAQE